MTTDDILSRLEHVRRMGQGWRSRCPVHRDRSGSTLSVRTGDDGATLIKCFAGCTNEEIVKAIGLKLGDLFIEDKKVVREPEPWVAPEGRWHQPPDKPRVARRVPLPKDFSAKLLQEALAQTWAEPGVLEGYVFADQIRHARLEVARLRSVDFTESPEAWERLDAAARLETLTNELEAILDEVPPR